MITLVSMQDFVDLTYRDETYSYVFYFSTPWCVPCRKLKPIMQKLHDDQIVDVFYIDAEGCDPEIVKEFNVQSVPALWFGNNGGYTALNARTIIGLLSEINELKDDVNG